MSSEESPQRRRDNTSLAGEKEYVSRRGAGMLRRVREAADTPAPAEAGGDADLRRFSKRGQKRIGETTACAKPPSPSFLPLALLLNLRKSA